MRLFILDHNLFQQAGHPWNMALGFRAAAARRGIETRFYVHKATPAELARQIGAEAVFPARPYAKRDKDPMTSVRMLSAGFREGCEALSRAGIDAADLVLVPNTFNNEIIGAAAWLATLPPEKRPRVAFNLNSDRPHDPTKEQWNLVRSAAYRYGGDQVKRVLESDRYRFMSPIEESAGRYRELLQCPVHVLTTPTNFELLGPPDETRPRGAPGEKIRIACLGPSTPVKGFHLIGAVVERLHGSGTPVRFFVQAMPPFAAEVWGRAFRGSEAARDLEVFPGEMSPEAYAQALHAADIVLLPYDPKEYRVMDSGIMSEAAGLGKVVVVPAETWMAERLRRGEVSGEIFESFDADSIAEALRRAVERFEELAVRAAAGAPAFRREHGIDRYLDRVLACFAQPQEPAPAPAASSSDAGPFAHAEATHDRRAAAGFRFPQRILYYCPDSKNRSGEVARLYRHVRILARNGIDAAILHNETGFLSRNESEEDTPVRYFKGLRLDRGDILVLPEGLTDVMRMLRGFPVRRFVIVLNWHYVYSLLPPKEDYRSYGVEGVIVVAPFVAEFMRWTMGLPVHPLDFSIDSTLYFEPERKERQISYLRRKAVNADLLQRVLRSRRAGLVDELEWKGLDGLSRTEYAAEIRRSSIFLNLSPTEGIPISMLEAMSAGCLAAGYDGVGGKGVLVGDGPRQNAMLVQCEDYASLAYALEPLLTRLLEGQDLSPWRRIVDAGKALAHAHTPESEERSVLEFWERVLEKS